MHPPFRMRLIALLLCVFAAPLARATVFSQLQGIVHDPQHRPIPSAQITLAAANSAFTQSAQTNSAGEFSIPNIPLGDYTITVSHAGFQTLQQSLTIHSGTSPVLHFELPVASVSETVNVTAPLQTAAEETATPTTLISRSDIAQTPGADRTNSLAMITDFVPGAYMTHDMLHIRGGHQVSWLIDGVEVPNTNISGNLAAQIDPKDIDYLEIQRGSYTADIGDRTYGAFNIVPRTGFERSRQAELVLSAGNFFQTNDQLSLGDHTAKFAWYASLNGNRSDFGLAPPTSRVVHDAANGFGGFASLIYNGSPRDQFRLVTLARRDFFQIPYDPDPNDFENQQFDSSGLRDTQSETDAAALGSWVRTFNASTALQVSPLVHYNRARYSSDANDTPVATTADRSSIYAGAQATLTTTIARNTLQAGLFSFGQHDSNLFGAIFNDGSGTPRFLTPNAANGGVVEEYVSDTFKPTAWLTLTAGIRQNRFQSSEQGGLVENRTSPRAGVAVRIPRLNWVFRGFYGRYYQPPPLLTASGPIVDFAQANNTAFVPLHGERDEEHQFGVQIPLRGWIIDADTFRTRINNFLDHANVGNSSIYFPVTIDGALIRAWEITLRSPRLARIGQVHLAYSNQVGEQRGAITGGLICTPVGDPVCDAEFDYSPVDHDQRNTLNAGFNAALPGAFTASANVYYGSGFHNGSPDPATPYANDYLPAHTTVDLAIGRSFGQNVTASITATNLTNHRVLLDNSLTFGGFHFNEPRQVFAELRYRFKY